MNPPSVSIRPTPIGRGVFAEKEFVEGEIIEVAPTISDCTTKFTGLMGNYIFTDYNRPTCNIIAFGCASMYNHKNDPTAEWIVQPNDTIEIKALTNISKGQEIFISYGNEYWDSMGIQPK